MTVHIVEDDASVADSLRMLLTAHGQPVRVYRDAETFLGAGVPGKNDTIIVDLGLPGIDGSQLVRWLTQLREAPKVFVVTGLAEKQIPHDLAGLDEASLIRKPIEPKTVKLLLGEKLAPSA